MAKFRAREMSERDVIVNARGVSGYDSIKKGWVYSEERVFDLTIRTGEYETWEPCEDDTLTIDGVEWKVIEVLKS